MAKLKKQVEDDEPAGAPEWMVTFSDCMTLLLTFFVLILSFSSFRPKTLGSLASSFAHAMPAVGLSFTSEKESVHKNQQTENLEKINEGSETRTVTDKSTTNFMKEKKPLDFKNLKVFTVPSNRVFLGNGAVLSKEGKELCEKFVKFLRKMPSRIVISENGGGYNKDIGLTRALAILDAMTRGTGVSRSRFNITSSSLMPDTPGDERYVEITLLEPGIYE